MLASGRWRCVAVQLPLRVNAGALKGESASGFRQEPAGTQLLHNYVKYLSTVPRAGDAAAASARAAHTVLESIVFFSLYKREQVLLQTLPWWSSMQTTGFLSRRAKGAVNRGPAGAAASEAEWRCTAWMGRSMAQLRLQLLRHFRKRQAGQQLSCNPGLPTHSKQPHTHMDACGACIAV
jgi:hypothetical protein